MSSSAVSRYLKSSKVTSSLVNNVVIKEYVFNFPLDWEEVDNGSAHSIDVFVREISNTSADLSSPAMMYLQGGPGFPSPRPTSPISGWMKVALQNGYRVLLLDQRGTGSSTAMSVQRLLHLEKQGGIDLQALYLSNMRSDAIAHDIDAIRSALCGEKGKITLLGQSFGGFCMLSYLSFYSDNMSKGFFTCGLAPVKKSVTELYEATYRRILARNVRFYKRYPEDIKKVKDIIAHLHQRETSSSPVLLPRGGVLTVRRFLQLGHNLGSGSGIETLHDMLEEPWFLEGSPQDAVLSEAFLHSVEMNQYSFEYAPIYWLMHESIYMNGTSKASDWAAESVMQQPEFKDAFDPLKALANDDTVVNFTGEMVYSWMGDDYASLRPLKDVAAHLSQKKWDRLLYDLDSLEDVAKKVPCAALVSYDDVYVERLFSEETAMLLGGVDYCKLWVTNEFQHSGLRDDPTRVLETLIKMIDGDLTLPS